MSTEEEKPTEGVAAAAATSEEDKVKEEESTATFKPVVRSIRIHSVSDVKRDGFVGGIP